MTSYWTQQAKKRSSAGVSSIISDTIKRITDPYSYYGINTSPAKDTSNKNVTASKKILNSTYRAPTYNYLKPTTPITIKTGSSGNKIGSDGSSLEDTLNQINENVNGGSSGSGYDPVSYSHISLPNLNVSLSSQQIADLLSQAQQYGELGYSPALSQIDENLILSDQNMNKNIEETKPSYWTAMNDVTQSAANAVSRFLQNTNAMGRAGGQIQSGTADIEGAGVEGVSGLEAELNKRIASARLSNQEYKDAQGRLKVGIEKEKGLAVALKNLDLQENALNTERMTAQQDFQNALASSQDAQQWEQINLAIEQFNTNTSVMLEELGIKKQQATAELESTQLENELIKRSINAPTYSNAGPSMVNTPVGPMTQDQALKWGFLQPGEYYESGNWWE